MSIVDQERNCSDHVATRLPKATGKLPICPPLYWSPLPRYSCKRREEGRKLFAHARMIRSLLSAPSPASLILALLPVEFWIFRSSFRIFMVVEKRVNLEWIDIKYGVQFGKCWVCFFENVISFQLYYSLLNSATFMLSWWKDNNALRRKTRHRHWNARMQYVLFTPGKMHSPRKSLGEICKRLQMQALL